MITVRLENYSKDIRALYPYPKVILEDGRVLIEALALETLIDLYESDARMVGDSIDYLLRGERITLASRQVIVEKVLAIIEFYKERHGTFNENQDR